MELYYPGNPTRGEHQAAVRATLANIDHLVLHDLVALMGGDPWRVADEQLAMVESDLRSNGFSPGRVSMWGSPHIPRWVRAGSGLDNERALRLARIRREASRSSGLKCLGVSLLDRPL